MNSLKFETGVDGIDDDLNIYLLSEDPSMAAIEPYPLSHPLGEHSQQQLQLLAAPPPPFPVTPVGPPERYTIYEPAQFVVQINSSEIQRKKYLFSHRLNRIYVDNNTPVGVEFNWNRKVLYNIPMYVRATVVFADEAQAQKRVETCVQHQHSAISAGKTQAVAKNVLVSSRANFNNSDVYYSGDPANPDSWLSVLVKFTKTSDEPCRHAYQFVCKNSCVSGINRRSIDIIFTLEDENGVVHGRQCVGARVCACPIRDLRRDERDRAAAPDAAPAKKRRVEPGLMPLMPPLPIADLEAVEIGIRTAVDVMKVFASRGSTDPQTADNYKKSIAAFSEYLENLKKPPPS